jgi:hypothetical protein
MRKMKKTPYTLSDLNLILKDEFKMKPKYFDGIYLKYPKVTFALVSVDDKWIITTGKEVTIINTKELKETVDNYLKR